jgi:fructose-1,6-bisphosphatase/inositol monophosphatase family enzyme
MNLGIKSYSAGGNMVPYLDAKGTSSESGIDLGIETKSGAEDFCTKVDVDNEKMIMYGIQQVFPKHDIIGEETVGTGAIPPLKKEVPTWIIDPIGMSYDSL